MRTTLAIACLVFSLTAVGCADDTGSSSSSSSDTGTGTDTSADAAASEGSYCEQNPVTETKQFCASMLVPEDLEGEVEKVSVHFFASFPPAGPPSFMGKELMSADELAPFVAGAEVPLVIENLPSSGEGHLVAVIYMPGGGALTWAAVSGVDYEGAALEGAAIAFTGEPINIDEPIVMNLVP